MSKKTNMGVFQLHVYKLRKCQMDSGSNECLKTKMCNWLQNNFFQAFNTDLQDARSFVGIFSLTTKDLWQDINSVGCDLCPSLSAFKLKKDKKWQYHHEIDALRYVQLTIELYKYLNCEVDLDKVEDLTRRTIQQYRTFEKEAAMGKIDTPDSPMKGEPDVEAEVEDETQVEEEEASPCETDSSSPHTVDDGSDDVGYGSENEYIAHFPNLPQHNEEAVVAGAGDKFRIQEATKPENVWLSPKLRMAAERKKSRDSETSLDGIICQNEIQLMREMKKLRHSSGEAIPVCRAAIFKLDLELDDDPGAPEQPLPDLVDDEDPEPDPDVHPAVENRAARAAELQDIAAQWAEVQALAGDDHVAVWSHQQTPSAAADDPVAQPEENSPNNEEEDFEAMMSKIRQFNLHGAVGQEREQDRNIPVPLDQEMNGEIHTIADDNGGQNMDVDESQTSNADSESEAGESQEMEEDHSENVLSWEEPTPAPVMLEAFEQAVSQCWHFAPGAEEHFHLESIEVSEPEEKWEEGYCVAAVIGSKYWKDVGLSIFVMEHYELFSKSCLYFGRMLNLELESRRLLSPDEQEDLVSCNLNEMVVLPPMPDGTSCEEIEKESLFTVEKKKKGPLHPNKPCSFYLEGCCFRSDCKYSHDLSTITCHFWKEGQCFKGDLCPFLHGYSNKKRRPRPRASGRVDVGFRLKKEEFPALCRERKPTNSVQAQKKRKLSKKLTSLQKNMSGNGIPRAK